MTWISHSTRKSDLSLGYESPGASELVELEAWFRLLCTHTTPRNLGARIVLPTHGRTGDPPQHRDLTRVRERVSDRTLKESLEGHAECRLAGEIVVERGKRAEEARTVLAPRLHGRVLPPLGALRHRERPIEEVAHVREDLRRCTAPRTDAESGKFRRRIAKRLSGAIRERRQRVSQKLARTLIHGIA